MRQPLLASELLVNQDGSIYHLGLLPDQVPATVLTVGDPERVALLARHLDATFFEVRRREFVSIGGRVGTHNVLILSTGIGTDNIEIVLTELDALVNVNLTTRQTQPTLTSLEILRIGTTGALIPAIEPGQAIYSQLATGLDALGGYYLSPDMQGADTYWDMDLGKFLSLPSTPYTVSHGNTKAQTALAPFATMGHTLTAPGFYLPQGRRTRLFDAPSFLSRVADHVVPDGAPALTNLEMETAGIYLLSHLYGHKAGSLSLAVVNRVSDRVVSNPEQAMERMVERAFAALF